MRVMQIVQRLAPGGLETVAASLQRRWGAGCRIVSLEGACDDLIAAWPAMADLQPNLLGVGKQAGLDPLCLFRLTRYLMREKPHAIVTHHIGPLLYGGIAARLARVPVIAHVEHDAWHLNDPAQFKRFKLACSLVRPRLAAISDLGAQSLRERTKSAVQRVTNGVDMKLFAPAPQRPARARLGLPLEGKIIGTVARLQRVKGIDLLVSALAHCDPSVSLAIIGDGDEREALEAQARALDLSERIHFMGVRGSIETILPSLDAFVLPSRAEGLPLALVEAQACGIPVIACDVGGVREACCPDTALLTPAENPQLLAHAIACRLTRPTVQSPRNFVMRQFSLDKMISDYANLTGALA